MNWTCPKCGKIISAQVAVCPDDGVGPDGVQVAGWRPREVTVDPGNPEFWDLLTKVFAEQAARVPGPPGVVEVEALEKTVRRMLRGKL